MRQPFVSVVMPIYNTAKFLPQSMDGLINQTLQNIEIICVNDGSQDDSLAIIKEYVSRDTRIKIIDQPNRGYGYAINRGIEAASGEYIGNLDPDDFTDLGMYEKLYRTAKAYDADVVKSNYFKFEGAKGESRFFEVLKGLPYNQITSANENEEICHRQPCIWSAIYKKELLINNHIFLLETPGSSYQDTAFAFKIWVNAKRVVFLKDAFVHYRTDNENSAVHNSDKVFYICDEFNAIQSYLNSDEKLRNKFSKILQVLKYDTYTWNLNRISEEYKEIFRDQIALEFIKAECDGFLDKAYFDEERWIGAQKYIYDYRFRIKSLTRQLEDTKHRLEMMTKSCEEKQAGLNALRVQYEQVQQNQKRLQYEFDCMSHSVSFRAGRVITFIPRKLRNGVRCYREHGAAYTLRRTLWHLGLISWKNK